MGFWRMLSKDQQTLGSRQSTKPSMFSQRAQSMDRSNAKKYRTIDNRAVLKPADGVASPKPRPIRNDNVTENTTENKPTMLKANAVNAEVNYDKKYKEAAKATSLAISGWGGSSCGAPPATAAAKTRKLQTAHRMDVEVPHRFGEKAASVTGRPQP